MGPLPTSVVRWLAPVIAAGALLAADALVSDRYRASIPPIGSTAPFCIRAPTDAAIDLRAAFDVQAKRARASYVPIYDKDNDVFYGARKRVLADALERPLDRWPWPAVVPPASEVRDAGSDGIASDAGGFASDADALAVDGSPATSRPTADGGATPTAAVVADAGAGPEPAETAPPDDILLRRRAELQLLVRGSFDILEPFYKAGVIADAEYPQRKDRIRIFWQGDYVFRSVAGTHRMSALRMALRTRAAKFFFKTDRTLLDAVTDYVLKRLPVNLTYAKENGEFIADISQVTGIKVVLIRRGELLVDRGDAVDSRAHSAIRASYSAAHRTSTLEREVGRLALLLPLLLIFGVAGRNLLPREAGGVRLSIAVYAILTGLVISGGVGLAYWPLEPVVVPQAAVAMVVAVIAGRGAAMLAAATVAACLALTMPFDVVAIVASGAGGLTGALVMRPRRRLPALGAGVLVGTAQFLAYEAGRAALGWPQTYAELWSAGQAFAGGVLGGLAAFVLLPFVQRWVGQTSRGKLRLLADFDSALARRFRERSPDDFAHAVRVVNLADAAAKAVGADRLLTRAGALLHDVGKIEHGTPDAAATGDEWVRARRAHVAAGARVAREHRVPHEVVALIVEHHGDAPIDDAPPTAVGARFAGPRPSSLSSAIVMIANRVDATTRLAGAQDVAPATVVESCVAQLFAAAQFSRSPITQEQLETIKQALSEYLEQARRP